MRLHVLHETAYEYETPVNWAIQTLRLTPRGHDSQYVVDWRIEVDHDCRLDAASDAFGNRVHSFTVTGPLDGLVITAIGIVETEDTNGVLSNQVERFPLDVFLRETPLTMPDAAIREFAEAARTAAGGDPLAVGHNLMGAIHEAMKFEAGPTDATTTAAEAFRHRQGVCQDFAHLFIAAARYLEVPARYVGGYLYQPGTRIQTAGHGWAEAHIAGFGWVGFDPANDLCPTDAYVRVAIGLDYLGAAPVRGTRYGGTDETLSVRIEVKSLADTRR